MACRGEIVAKHPPKINKIILPYFILTVLGLPHFPCPTYTTWAHDMGPKRQKILGQQILGGSILMAGPR